MDVVVGLGGNLGDRQATLSAAVRALRALGDLTATSCLYETAPFGPPQPEFLNAAVRLTTLLAPLALLDALLEVERRHGRLRREKWGPRTLDLDILWIAGVSIDEVRLEVPHARLRERLFALVPLLEVAPEARHPETGEALRRWLEALPQEGIRLVHECEWARSPTAQDADRTTC